MSFHFHVLIFFETCEDHSEVEMWMHFHFVIHAWMAPASWIQSKDLYLFELRGFWDDLCHSFCAGHWLCLLEQAAKGSKPTTWRWAQWETWRQGGSIVIRISGWKFDILMRIHWKGTKWTGTTSTMVVTIEASQTGIRTVRLLCWWWCRRFHWDEHLRTHPIMASNVAVETTFQGWSSGRTTLSSLHGFAVFEWWLYCISWW